MSDEVEVGGFAGATTRTEFIRRAGVGVGGLVVAGGLPTSALARVLGETAPEASTIKIGFISPRTGPAAGFGEPDPYALALARKKLSKGLVVGGKRYAVQIIDKDNQSSPPRAAALAKQLINSNKVDFMLSTSTPEVNNPVADAGEAAGVPHLTTV